MRLIQTALLLAMALLLAADHAEREQRTAMDDHYRREVHRQIQDDITRLYSLSCYPMLAVRELALEHGLFDAETRWQMLDDYQRMMTMNCLWLANAR